MPMIGFQSLKFGKLQHLSKFENFKYRYRYNECRYSSSIDRYNIHEV